MPGLGKEDPPIENNAPFSYLQSSAPTVLPPSCPAKSLEPLRSRTIKSLCPQPDPRPPSGSCWQTGWTLCLIPDDKVQPPCPRPGSLSRGWTLLPVPSKMKETPPRALPHPSCWFLPPGSPPPQPASYSTTLYK